MVVESDLPTVTTNVQQDTYVVAVNSPQGSLRDVPMKSTIYSCPAEEVYHGIPGSLLKILVQAYFDNVYNAHLLLHKRSFLESLTAGVARAHVVLGVCAWAAKYEVQGTQI